MERFEHEGFTITIEHDHDFDYDTELSQSKKNVTVFGSYWHQTSTLSQYNVFETSEQMRAYSAEHGHRLFLLHRYQHGEVMFGIDNTVYPFNCQWDAGTEGLVMVHRDVPGPELMATDLCKYLTQLYNGQVYMYLITDSDGDLIDSCGGIVGYDDAVGLAKTATGDLSNLT